MTQRSDNHNITSHDALIQDTVLLSDLIHRKRAVANHKVTQISRTSNWSLMLGPKITELTREIKKVKLAARSNSRFDFDK